MEVGAENQHILDTNELNEIESKWPVDGLTSYSWHIDTRYYTADILVSSINERTIGNEEFAEKVEAFIAHFDTSKVETFEGVKRWLPFLNELDPEVRILLCDTCQENDEVSRKKAWDWCLDNSFELVELFPQEAEPHPQDLEDDYTDTTGIQRVIQALHNHTWSNLVMKEKPSFRSEYMKDMMREHARERDHPESQNQTSPENEESQACANKTETNEFKSETGGSDNVKHCETEDDTSITESNVATELNAQDTQSSQNTDPVIDPSYLLAGAYGGDEVEDDETQDFEKLFQSFRLMKDKAQDLPFEERKKYAEQVAIQFWKAIGGDEDEIGDLDSDPGA